MSPFEVVYGFNPLNPTDLLPLPSNEHLNVNGRDRAQRIKEMHKAVKENLEKAANTYAKYANRGRRAIIFHPGDWVWVHMRKERFPNQRKSKLSPRGDGPFKVLERINDNAYRLDLSGEYGVNASFNVADLSLYDRADEDASRLKVQPSQGGGDDTEVPSAQAGPYLPTGPITRSRAKVYQNALQAILRRMDDEDHLLEGIDRDDEMKDSTNHPVVQHMPWSTCISLLEEPMQLK